MGRSVAAHADDEGQPADGEGFGLGEDFGAGAGAGIKAGEEFFGMSLCLAHLNRAFVDGFQPSTDFFSGGVVGGVGEEVGVFREKILVNGVIRIRSCECLIWIQTLQHRISQFLSP